MISQFQQTKKEYLNLEIELTTKRKIGRDLAEQIASFFQDLERRDTYQSFKSRIQKVPNEIEVQSVNTLEQKIYWLEGEEQESHNELAPGRIRVSSKTCLPEDYKNLIQFQSDNSIWLKEDIPNYLNVNYSIFLSQDGSPIAPIRLVSSWSDNTEITHPYPVYDIISLHHTKQKDFDKMIEEKDKIILIH